ncbi:MAG: phage major capsid protein [Herbinix sp.]|nr:phage major capsid protein [Herbinix sp.]
MRLEEINQRLSAIKAEINTEGADLDALDTEVTALKEERKGIMDKAEKRKALLDGVANLENPTIIKTFEEEKEKRTMEFNKENVYETAEYRSAFLNNLRGIELNEVEKRAFTTATGSAGAVIPTTTQNKIVEVVKQQAPLLNEIYLMQVPGGVSIPVEDVVNEAAKHTENATITASDDTLKYVDLFGYEVTKLLYISKSVLKMSISAFETWLVNSLGKTLAAKITKSIIYGTGTGEAKGVDKITWGATNSVTVALAGSLTAQSVLDTIALLPGGFDANAKFLMSKKTLLTDFVPLQDKAKNNLVSQEGRNYFIQGYPVMLDERITLHEAILGDFYAGYYGNMPEDANVDGGFVRASNNYEYLGACMFDGKPAIEDAFVKIVKAVA